MEENVWFQVGLCPEKFQLDQIQNGGYTILAIG